IPMMTCLRCLAVSLCILAGGCAAREKVPASTTRRAAVDDLARLQGEWAMVSGTADGFELPAVMLPNMRRVCRGNELTVTNGGQCPPYRMRRAKPAARRPPAMGPRTGTQA